MKWTRGSGAFALALCVLGVCATRSVIADQPFGWTHTWLYIFGPDFDDFHATYTGTGGTIDREVLVTDTAGGGMISAALNTIDITWPDTWVVPGDSFSYDFNTAFPEIAFAGGSITKGGVVIGIVDVQGVIHEPTGQTIGLLEHSFIPGPGSLVVLALAGVVARRRRSA